MNEASGFICEECIVMSNLRMLRGESLITIVIDNLDSAIILGISAFGIT